ncbi:MAG: MFS transporter [Actinobacteria bacterium]|nr:MFS transporter [Actinomycetota bacterium]
MARRITSVTRESLPKGFVTIWITVALDLVGFGIVVPILGRYAERFGASGLEVGLLFASFSLAQLVFSPILGKLSDRIGRKPVILISLLGTAIGSFVTGAAGALWVLFLGRILDGASGASVAVAQGAVTDVAAPEERPRLLGLLGAAFGVGFVVGPALGGLAALGGEHLPFFVAGTVALINAIVAFFRLPETRPEEARVMVRESRESEQVLVRLWGLAVAGFVAIVAFSGFESTFSLLAGDRFDLTEAGVAAVFVGVGLTLVGVQTLLVRPVNAAWGTERSVQAGLALNTAGLVVLSLAEQWPSLVVALLSLTVGQGLVTPNLSALVSGRVPDHRRGEALGFQQGVNAVGRVAGPALAGLLYDNVSIGAPYLVGGALCGLALMVVSGARRSHS